MDANTEKYVIATFALWAGDFTYFEKILREFSAGIKSTEIDDQIELPEKIIQRIGALRLRQLRQKKGEFKQLVAEYRSQGLEVQESPKVLESKHLRATLWRLGVRDFLLQGYLIDMKWQEELFQSAQKEAGMEKKHGIRDESGAFKPLGASWIVSGNPFIQVELTDLGLLEATGLWTAKNLPQKADLIIEPFQKLLNTLGGPTNKI